MAARSISQWFADYGESHRNPVNKRLHFVCVPAIFFSIVGLLWAIPMPDALLDLSPFFNIGTLSLLIVIGFYARLSLSITVGMLAFAIACLLVLWGLESAGVIIWLLSLIVFVVGWIGQFIGHHIEGKKPSFFEDLQFLMIGPAWIMGFLYRRWGIAY
ncbi:MAG: DUF962 domain-containing protein [Gammaproteobacteria bacterium]|nr:DUF962 domain-containing protein [Gammaproteobacteria bacterium]